MQIAAAGFHNIILYGPVGSGKSMLAKSLKSVLPKLDYEESLEKGRVYSTTSIRENFNDPVFREIYHTASPKHIFGSTKDSSIGEVTLSNNGVLFLDEMLEFKKDTLEALRKVLEDRKIFMTRLREFIECPAKFILLGATNLCPCGNYLNNSSIKQCVCDNVKREKYINKLSKSMLDRIDIFTYVPVIYYLDLGFEKDMRMTTKQVLNEVVEARDIQGVGLENLELSIIAKWIMNS